LLAMQKKREHVKRGNGKEPKHVHVETGPNKCLSYQVETTADVFQSVLGRVSRKAATVKPNRSKLRRKVNHA
jgi:hypothetical protein